jgi:hypothetical protein
VYSILSQESRTLFFQRTAIGKTTLAAAVAIVVLVAGVVVLDAQNQVNPGGTPVLNSSRPTATTNSSSLTSSPSTTTTTLYPNPGGSTTQTTGNATAPCPSSTTCASSFTYDGSINLVRVDSVQATQFVCNNCGAVNGQSYVTFAVNFENIGLLPPLPSEPCSNCKPTIYIAAGTAGLTVSEYPSPVLQSVPSQMCPGTSSIVALENGQTYTMYGPGCDAGYNYQVVQAGTVTLTFIFHWAMSSQMSAPLDDTVITAQFTFA